MHIQRRVTLRFSSRHDAQPMAILRYWVSCPYCFYSLDSTLFPEATVIFLGGHGGCGAAYE
eukprot:scaffold7650_cov30-Tisochrysis_lutea.AAC.2